MDILKKLLEKKKKKEVKKPICYLLNHFFFYFGVMESVSSEVNIQINYNGLLSTGLSNVLREHFFLASIEVGSVAQKETGLHNQW